MNIYLYLGNDLFLKIFHTPEAVAIIFPLHSKSQTKKIIDFVFFEIVAVPKISSPSLVGAINLISKAIVTHGLFSTELCAAEPHPASIIEAIYPPCVIPALLR